LRVHLPLHAAKGKKMRENKHPRGVISEYVIRKRTTFSPKKGSSGGRLFSLAKEAAGDGLGPEGDGDGP